MAKSSGKSSKTTAKKSTKAKATKKKAPAKKAKRKVMDISRPGKTRAESTSKPVIVGHKPMVQDPMMTSPSTDSSKKPASPPPPSASKKVIVPLSGDAKPEETAAQDTDESTASDGMIPNLPDLEHALAKDRAKEPESSTEEVETDKESEASDDSPEISQEANVQDTSSDDTAPDVEPASPEKPSEPELPAEESNEAAVVDTLLGQLGDKQQQSKDEMLAKEQENHINKLVEQKKYYIPIAKARRRRRRRHIALLLAVLLLLGGVAAAESGIFPGVEPPLGLFATNNTIQDNTATNNDIDTEATTANDPTDTAPELQSKTYSFEQYDLSFEFTEIGEIEIVKNETSQATVGTAYLIGLAAEKLQAGFVTRDFSSTNDFVGFTTYRGCVNPLDNAEAEITLYEDDTTCVKVVGYVQEGDETTPAGNAAYLLAQKSLPDNETTAGVEVVYSPLKVNDFEEATLKSAYPPEIITLVSDFIRSVQNTTTE